MKEDSKFDLFISYARADDASGWIYNFVEALNEEHRRFSGGRELRVFFDRESIGSFDDWEKRIRSALAASSLMIAFISPRLLCQ